MMQKPKILAADNTKVALRYMETILGEYVWNGWLRSSPPDKRG